MNSPLIDKIVEAVLYEGYVLYPYRSTALKNRQRWNFGVLQPEGREQAAGERSSMQTECIILAEKDALLTIELRFLHLQKRDVFRLVHPVVNEQEITPDLLERVDVIEIDGKRYESWEEAIERRCSVPGLRLEELKAAPQQVSFHFDNGKNSEPLQGQAGNIEGSLIRSRQSIDIGLLISAERLSEEASKLAISIVNRTPLDPSIIWGREELLMKSLLSTHTVMNLQQGRFISMVDAPAEHHAAVASCRNVGCWPVLAGEEGEADCMLSSPIILYDYPQIAPESPIAMFDGAEIDELLALRIMTLTDDEKARMAGADELTRRMLERTSDFSNKELLNLHGVMRPASLERERG